MTLRTEILNNYFCIMTRNWDMVSNIPSGLYQLADEGTTLKHGPQFSTEISET